MSNQGRSKGFCYQGVIAIEDISPKLISNSDLVKCNSPITSTSVVQSFWNFAQSMAVSLPCSVQNFTMIGQLKNKLWAIEISWYSSSRWVSVGGISSIVTAHWVTALLCIKEGCGEHVQLALEGLVARELGLPGASGPDAKRSRPPAGRETATARSHSKVTNHSHRKRDRTRSPV